MLNKFRLYIAELRQEFKRINWPDRSEAIKLSTIVIIISLIVAVFLGGLDYIFITILERTV